MDFTCSTFKFSEEVWFLFTPFCPHFTFSRLIFCQELPDLPLISASQQISLSPTSLLVSKLSFLRGSEPREQCMKCCKPWHGDPALHSTEMGCSIMKLYQQEGTALLWAYLSEQHQIRFMQRGSLDLETSRNKSKEQIHTLNHSSWQTSQPYAVYNCEWQGTT